MLAWLAFCKYCEQFEVKSYCARARAATLEQWVTGERRTVDVGAEYVFEFCLVV